MVLLSGVFSAEERAASLALAYSAAHIVGVVLLAPLALKQHEDRFVPGVVR